MRKLIFIRPGALGDTLALRVPILLARASCPSIEIGIVTSREIGALLVRPGWANGFLDGTSAEASHLFSDKLEKTKTLSDFFSHADAVIFYGSDNNGILRKSIASLSPESRFIVFPSQPEPWIGYDIFSHLTLPLVELELSAAADFIAGSRDADALPRITVFPKKPNELHGGSYAMIHPGSGSKSKNWPGDRYADVAKWLLQSNLAGISKIVVTAGEADEELGHTVAACIPDSILVNNKSLSYVADTASRATLVVTGDSGIAHLAAAIQSTDTPPPRRLALFGPSDDRIWEPPGTHIIASPTRNIRDISTESVKVEIMKILSL